jgi:radical SAM protein with 4Fe4S-binding SPASM domain
MLPHLVLGRAGRDRLLGVWRTAPALVALRERSAIALDGCAACAGCAYVPYCTGNCPATAYALTGALDQPSPDGCLRRYLAAGGRLPG